MTGVLAYYLYLYWYAVTTAREYDMQLGEWEIERKGIFLMFCPLLNCIATVVVWCCIPKAKTHIKYLIIMSTHPDMQDPPEDEDIW
jgi:hypothetical protein